MPVDCQIPDVPNLALMRMQDGGGLSDAPIVVTLVDAAAGAPPNDHVVARGNDSGDGGVVPASDDAVKSAEAPRSFDVRGSVARYANRFSTVSFAADRKFWCTYSSTLRIVLSALHSSAELGFFMTTATV